MSPLAALLVALGGALGAAGRFAVDGEVTRRRPPSPARGARSRVPPGTLVVNAAGALALGVLAALLPTGAVPLWWAFAATGVCGGFTTFSTASLEAVRLALAGRWGAAAATAGAHLAVSVLAVAAGFGLGAVLAPLLSALLAPLRG